MEKQLKEYLRFLDEELAGMPEEDLPSLWQQHLAKTRAFQHERLVHLLVTLFFGILVFLSFVLYFLVTTGTIVSGDTEKGTIMLFALSFGLLVLEIFYIRHYYILENGVQKLYTYNQRFAGLKE